MLGMTGVVPPQIEGEPQGWRYPQTIRDGSQWITGDDHDNLIQKVTSYRIDNSIPLGNPEEDVDAYICGRWKNYCASSPDRVPVAATKPRTFRERVTSWAANRYEHAGAIALVSQETADARAAICAECPFNSTWRTGCAPCIEVTDRTLVMIRQARTAKPSTLGCMVAGQDNPTAVWLPKEHLKHSTKYSADLYEKCWMLKLNE
jgi:hypothetical protein